MYVVNESSGHSKKYATLFCLPPVVIFVTLLRNPTRKSVTYYFNVNQKGSLITDVKG